jgi:hypothetical protein
MATQVRCARIARKPARSLRLVCWNEAQRLGVLSITVGKESATYSLVEIEAGFADRAFRISKVSTDGVEADYAVALERQGHSCECLGFLRHGHCKHSDSIRKLLELGKI